MKTSGLLMTGAMMVMSAMAWGEAKNMIGQMSQNEGMVAVPAPKGGVVVDGDLSEWDLSGEIWSFADMDLRETFSVKSAMMWDRENLYVSFRWKDPMPMNSTVDPAFDPGLGWRADAEELRMWVGKMPLWFTCWHFEGKSCALLAYWNDLNPHSKVPMDSKLYVSEKGSAALGDGIESAYKRLPEGDGFVHELKIPWTVFAKCGQEGVPERFRCGLEFKWGAENGSGWPLHRFTDNMSEGCTSREFYWMKKEAWGEVVLGAESVKEKREYVRAVEKPFGTIPVRAKVPEGAAVFTLVIEDAEGKRVRNLAGGFDVAAYRVDAETVEVLWDGLDDAGVAVPAGTYSVRGLWHAGLTPKYEMSLYNPGTPAWGTADGTGAWGSDHTRVRCVAASGENVALASAFVEGGYGVWGMGPEGRKIWSEIRGVLAMSANAKYVFTVPVHWYSKEECLYRYDAVTGKFAPFVLEGKERPLELPIREILGWEELKPLKGELSEKATVEEKTANPKIVGLAAGPESVLVMLAEGKVAEIDHETGVCKGVYTLGYDWTPLTEGHPFVPMAYDGKTIFYYRKGVLTKWDVATGTTQAMATSVAVEKPTALALDGSGAVYVADCGADMQVKKFGADGVLLGTFGKKGGRARTGKFDPEAMRVMSSIAVDARGDVWAVEYSDFPRRVSVWKPDGSLKRDYIGNTGYAGVGVLLHDTDPGRVFVGPNELSYDEKTYTYQMESVLVNPEEGALTFKINTGDNSLGHVFYSEASGKKREYFYRDQRLFMKGDDGSWRAVACVLELGKILGLFTSHHHNTVAREADGEFAGLNPWDLVFWCDTNGDGIVQRAECDVMPQDVKYEVGKEVRWHANPRWMTWWGSRVDPEDLSLYVVQRHAEPTAEEWRMVPAGFTADGVPRWTVETARVIARNPSVESFELVPTPWEDTVVTLTQKDKRGVLMGMTKEGVEKWTYPSPYTGVHGSHRAVMPKAGLLIGPLKVLGFVRNCGEAGNVFAIRGNLGEDYYLTTDGLFVSNMFRDTRLPSQVPPQTEEEMRAMPFGVFSMGGEPFNGCIMRHDDGVVRMICGAPAREAANLVRIEGLEGIRRIAATGLELTPAMVEEADAANRAREAALEAGKPYGVARVAGAAVDWAKVKPMRLEVAGQSVKGECRVAMSETTLFAQWRVQGDDSPWKNAGTDKTRMFKTGDCVDLCVSPSANAARDAKEGDARIVVSPFGEGAVAMLLRKVCATAKAEERVRYQSPVRAFEMAQVKEVGTVKVMQAEGVTTVELAVPLAELGLSAKAGTKLRGDAGMILSDAAGRANVARIYHYNKNTNLVNDLPGEADLYPAEWGEWVVE